MMAKKANLTFERIAPLIAKNLSHSQIAALLSQEDQRTPPYQSRSISAAMRRAKRPSLVAKAR
jgi:hypothetical protein